MRINRRVCISIYIFRVGMRQFWRVVKRSESFRRSCEQSAGYRCEQLINHFPSRALPLIVGRAITETFFPGVQQASCMLMPAYQASWDKFMANQTVFLGGLRKQKGTGRESTSASVAQCFIVACARIYARWITRETKTVMNRFHPVPRFSIKVIIDRFRYNEITTLIATFRG